MYRALSIFTLALTLAAGQYTVAQHRVEKLWETDSVLAIPESVLPQRECLYVSLIDGGAWEADHKGGVARLDRYGKVLSDTWITGLDAPKGLARYGDFLYVADLSTVVVINIPQNKIDHKIMIPGATGLNDITVGNDGTVYVTDSRQSNVFEIHDGKPTLYADGLKGVNGIKAVGKLVYILTGDGMYVSDAPHQVKKLCELEHGGDGIEPVGNGDFLVTAWSGWLYYVNASGTKQVLLDTHETNHKTADIGYDPATKTLYVPTFLGKSVAAYRLD